MEDEELNGMIVDSFGCTKFYVDSHLRREDRYLHREDGPAVISPEGIQYWLIKDRLHREDGPAIVYPDGYSEYYIEGNEMSELQFMLWKIQNFLL